MTTIDESDDFTETLEDVEAIKEDGHFALWKYASEKLEIKFAKKGTAEYKLVREEVDRLNNIGKTEQQLLWGQTCKKLGYNYVKKGTKEYEKVKQAYKK